MVGPTRAFLNQEGIAPPLFPVPNTAPREVNPHIRNITDAITTINQGVMLRVGEAETIVGFVAQLMFG
jgi:hypothetical protein